MRKNKMMRLASGLLVAVLLTTSMISGTFAKYISEATGSDEARVAKWEINLEEAEISNTFNFDLFKTVLDSDGSAEDDVLKAADDATTIIAPGTTGSFVIDLENKSEVNAEYAIAYTMTETSNIPIQFALASAPTDWKDNISELNVAEVAIAMGNGDADDTDKASVTVLWRWKFVQEDTAATEIPATGEKVGDKADTELGLAADGALPKITVSAKVTVTQVD